uniref:PPPDE domain-containing protein n=1 Tax=Oryza punctata TaxID=4537 RepID=A0A0E0MA42_ORYPU
MKEVVLHVYDVTNSDSEKTNNTILQINRIFKDRIGLGGIFHSAVQVYGEEEWSFGFCENGSGVFSCPIGKNPMYTYRECIVLGETECSIATVNRILRELSREWPGHSYDLLSRNCNHFCDVLCERLGVPKLPGWVNRFANAGDTAVVVAENTAVKFRQAKTEIVNASRVAYRFMAGLASKNQNPQPESPSNQSRNGPTFQGTWFKNIISNGAKPSSSESTSSHDTAKRLGYYGAILVLFETPSGFALFIYNGTYLYRPNALEDIWADFSMEPMQCDFVRCSFLDQVVFLKEFKVFEDKANAIKLDTGISAEFARMIKKWILPGQKLAVGKHEYKIIVEKCLGIHCLFDEAVMEVMWSLKNLMKRYLPEETSDLSNEDRHQMSVGMKMVLDCYGFDYVKPEMVNRDIIVFTRVLYE